MKLISTIQDLKLNLNTVEGYLSEGTVEEEDYTKGLIHRGNCFVAYKISGELRFAPSRFIGYKNNDYLKHAKSNSKDGRETNIAIGELLGGQPTPNPTLEEDYFSYCNSLGIFPKTRDKDGRQRKFWILDLGEKDFVGNLKEAGEFPEGKVVERAHKSRERSTEVIFISKRNFKIKHGCLFCEVCGFDFEKQYGELGHDYIEGHHTIPVSEMKPNHKTKPEDIAIVCSNCHRMLHKKRPWLSLGELKSILLK